MTCHQTASSKGVRVLVAHVGDQLLKVLAVLASPVLSRLPAHPTKVYQGQTFTSTWLVTKYLER